MKLEISDATMRWVLAAGLALAFWAGGVDPAMLLEGLKVGLLK